MSSTARWLWVLQVGLIGVGALDALRVLVGAAALAGWIGDSAQLVGFGLPALASGFGWFGVALGMAAWSYREVKNLQAAKDWYGDSPGAAAIGWLVPGWNLYKPYDTLNGLWSGLVSLDEARDPEPPGVLLTTFWVSWVAAVVIGRLFGGGAEDALVGAGDVVAAASCVVCAATGVALLRRLGGFEATALRVAAPR